MKKPTEQLSGGKRLASSSPEDDVVISGMSGNFPNSKNIADFIKNLENKVNLCDEDERRFCHTNSEIPRNSGKVYNLEDFDIGFFSMQSRQANLCEPALRRILEVTHEALLDAGIAIEDLAGTNTGVYVGICWSEQQKYIFDTLPQGCLGILWTEKSFLAHSISYWLKLNGPSVTCDTACSSSMYAFEEAYRALKEGRCDTAIVGGVNLLLNSATTLQFARLGVLNINKECRPFDDNANGYTRSESIVTLILQKSKDAKRIYAQVVHAKSNDDGFKAEGITFPSMVVQKSLLEDVYGECGISVADVGFVEAHGTGTQVGDVVELNAIDNFYCNEKRGGKPLIIGSVKGNIGHAEAASGLNSLVKVVSGMVHNCIYPNIHYENPRSGVDGLLSGRLQVATDILPWPENAPYAGVNSFGFGGANCHVILKKYENSKKMEPSNGLQLVCLSGRTEESITYIHDFLKDNKINSDFLSIVREAYRKRIPNNYYRGYAILSDNAVIKKSVKYCGEEPKPLYLCIGSKNKLNGSTLKELQKLPYFQQRVEHYVAMLNNNNIKIDLNPKETDIIGQIMCTLFIQLGIVDVIKTLNLTPSFVYGMSFGNFVAAYANGALSSNETILSTYQVTQHFLQSSNNESKKNLHVDLLNVLKSIISKDSKDSNNVSQQIVSKTNPFKYASPEYFVHNIINPTTIPTIDDGVILSIDFECKTNAKILELVTPNMKLENLLTNIGSLYELGYELEISGLYPKVTWPVSADTPSYSSLVKWDHLKKCYITRFDQTFDKTFSGQKLIEFNLKQNNFTYIKGHVIDGRNLFPATGYLICMAEWYSHLCKHTSFDQQKLLMEDVKFHKATTFGKNDVVSLNFMVNKTGTFEISENEVSVVTGRITVLENKNINELPKFEPSETKLLQKDIYKELRLRGYNYSGLFCGIKELCGNRGMVEWSNNFVAFLDNILQLFILQEDSRALYVPTGISKLVLDVQSHLEYINANKDIKNIPVFIDTKTNTLMTESITIIGVQASPIARRKQLLDPILEVSKFIPNEGTLTLEEALRVNAQIILENSTDASFKILEHISEERKPVSPIFQKAMEDHPVIQPVSKIISHLNFDFGEVEVANESIQSQNNNSIFIGSNLLSNEDVLESAIKTLTDNGYIIALESKVSLVPNKLTLITKYKIPDYTIYLISTKKNSNVNMKTFDVSGGLNWIKPLQNHLRLKPEAILYCEDEPENGILGLTNCLKREVKGGNISLFFVHDAPKFDIKDEFYQKQLQKGMSINVYKNGQWGTYRHLKLNHTLMVENEHCFGNVTQTGDLNTLKWISGPMKCNKESIVVYNSAINFRDLMTASGKVGIQAITKNRVEQECVMGIEYSGRNLKGERIMGMVQSGAIATLVQPNVSMMWKVPDEWTLEEAATVPVVYCTVLLALKMRTNVRKGQSILIHSGTGGIGLSAINVALHFGMTVFTTVGTEEKREYLKKTYPQINPSHIGNSRDTTFEEMIFKETNGRGVDYVLNSLSEEKLLASVRCLSKNGTFLEIGKFDISKDAELGIEFQNKGAAFHGVMLDKLFGIGNNKVKTQLAQLLQDGIEEGFVKPLPTTIFKMDQMQEAFRYMGTGKHIGKIVIKLREEETMKIVKPIITKHPAIARSYFDPEGSYIVLGGLGGFGLELTDWMVVRGARNIVLSSRNGIKNGYQKYVVEKLHSMGAKIIISKEDIKTSAGCLNIIKTANAMAPVQGIFNLAVELKDGAFDNLSEKDFEISFAPKARASTYLDTISRTHCPQLKHFVLFSSVSCGRGNAGQTNYGMSNSIMERLCEKRRAEGLPALAIQWGAIGDVGLVAEMQKEQTEIVIGGTLQQRISSCLEVMDIFLQSDAAVVASMVVAEKSANVKSDNVVDAIMNILGIRDIKTVGPHATLPELGMDSMMAVEIKQTLERDFDIFLTPQDIKGLTVNKLVDLHNEADVVCTTNSTPTDSFNMFLSNMYHENTYNLSKVDFVENQNEQKTFFFPGIEGVATSIGTLIKSTSKNATCFQYTSNEAFEELTHLYDDMWSVLQDSKDGFKFVGHSLGAIFALEMAAKLESNGKYGEIVLLDGSPDFVISVANFFNKSTVEFEVSILSIFMSKFLDKSGLHTLQEKLILASNYEERVNISLEQLPEKVDSNKTMLLSIGLYMKKVIKAIPNYTPSFTKKIKSKVTLFKADDPTIKNIENDFHLSKYCENIVDIKYFAGNHRTIVENKEMFLSVKKFLKN